MKNKFPLYIVIGTILFTVFILLHTLAIDPLAPLTAWLRCLVCTSPPTHRGYYTERETQLLKNFSYYLKSARSLKDYNVLEATYPGLSSEILDEFKKIIRDLPYIGGENDYPTKNLEESAGFLAFYKVVKSKGMSTKDAGLLSCAIYKTFLESLPQVVDQEFQSKLFSPAYQEMLKIDAEESQKRIYSGDWIEVFVSGDGKNFDFGLDYRECGIIKLYEKYGLSEFVPYQCAFDIIMSRATNLGLHRTTTLAENGKPCDFRYKKGAPTNVNSTVYR